MHDQPSIAIVTSASQGIGAGIVKRFDDGGYNVVANSQKITQFHKIAGSPRVALVDDEVGASTTWATIVETALACFNSIDVLVNKASIFFAKPNIGNAISEILRDIFENDKNPCRLIYGVARLPLDSLASSSSWKIVTHSREARRCRRGI